VDRALNILSLDDSEGDVKLLERALRVGDISFALRRVETREDFCGALGQEKLDVIFLDYKLPHFDGLAALRLAKQMRPEVPVIIVTGTISDELAVEFLQEGAADYIIKDRRSRLPVAVRRVIHEADQRAARLALEAKYQALLNEVREGTALVECDSGRVIECNAAFERLAGREAAVLRAMPLWDLGREGHRAALQEALQRDAGASPWLLTTRFARADGSEIALELSARAVAMPGRRCVQLLAREAMTEAASHGIG
jgi:PAS domain S-box-containing protein